MSNFWSCILQYVILYNVNQVQISSLAFDVMVIGKYPDYNVVVLSYGYRHYLFAM